MANEEKKADFFQGMLEMMKPWADAQRTWMQWMLDSAARTAEQFKGPGSPDVLRMMTEAWGTSYEEMVRRLRQFAPAGPGGDVYDTMLSAQTAYVKVLQWWGDAMAAAQRTGVPMDPKALADLWSRSNREFLSSMFVPPFVEPLRTWLGAGPGGMLPLPVKEYAETVAALGRQWMDFVARAGERAGQVVKGELKPEAATEMYESWLRTYQETLGRLFRVPAAGPAKDFADRQLKGMDAVVKYQAALADFYGRMVQPGTEALRELAATTKELTSAPLTPETFGKVYQTLLKTVEQRFAELFKSSPFLTTLENTLRTSVDFYGKMDELMEEQLRGMPFVTHRELQETLKDLGEPKERTDAPKKKR
jgi:hypothetical protein